jgi:hypothetical protein
METTLVMGTINLFSEEKRKTGTRFCLISAHRDAGFAPTTNGTVHVQDCSNRITARFNPRSPSQDFTGFATEIGDEPQPTTSQKFDVRSGSIG